MRTVAECGSEAAREAWVEVQLIGEYAAYIGLALPGACIQGHMVCARRAQARRVHDDVRMWRAHGVSI